MKAKYQVHGPIVRGEVSTYRGVDGAGMPVLLHFLGDRNPGEIDALKSLIQQRGTGVKDYVIEFAAAADSQVLVTWPIPEFTTLEGWLAPAPRSPSAPPAGFVVRPPAPPLSQTGSKPRGSFTSAFEPDQAAPEKPKPVETAPPPSPEGAGSFTNIFDPDRITPDKPAPQAPTPAPQAPTPAPPPGGRGSFSRAFEPDEPVPPSRAGGAPPKSGSREPEASHGAYDPNRRVPQPQRDAAGGGSKGRSNEPPPPHSSQPHPPPPSEKPRGGFTDVFDPVRDGVASREPERRTPGGDPPQRGAIPDKGWPPHDAPDPMAPDEDAGAAEKVDLWGKIPAGPEESRGAAVPPEPIQNRRQPVEIDWNPAKMHPPADDKPIIVERENLVRQNPPVIKPAPPPPAPPLPVPVEPDPPKRSISEELEEGVKGRALPKQELPDREPVDSDRSRQLPKGWRKKVRQVPSPDGPSSIPAAPVPAVGPQSHPPPLLPIRPPPVGGPSVAPPSPMNPAPPRPPSPGGPGGDAPAVGRGLLFWVGLAAVLVGIVLLVLLIFL